MLYNFRTSFSAKIALLFQQKESSTLSAVLAAVTPGGASVAAKACATDAPALPRALQTLLPRQEPFEMPGSRLRPALPNFNLGAGPGAWPDTAPEPNNTLLCVQRSNLGSNTAGGAHRVEGVGAALGRALDGVAGRRIGGTPEAEGPGVGAGGADCEPDPVWLVEIHPEVVGVGGQVGDALLEGEAADGLQELFP